MYVLCIHSAVTGSVTALVGRSRIVLMSYIVAAVAAGAAWRLFDTAPGTGGWCDGSPDAWKLIHASPDAYPARVVLD